MTAPTASNPWDNGVLDVHGVHARLIQNRIAYAEDAGIPASMLWTPLAESCPWPAEQVWVRAFRRRPTWRQFVAARCLRFSAALEVPG